MDALGRSGDALGRSGGILGRRKEEEDEGDDDAGDDDGSRLCDVHVYVYVCVHAYVLGALSLKQRAKRWLASCGFAR